MKFSMIFEAQLVDPTPDSEHRVLHDCVEQAFLAEEMGFDRVWAVEHHPLTRYAHMSASEIFLTWVAARTRTLRVGHGVVMCLIQTGTVPQDVRLETIRQWGTKVIPHFRETAGPA